MMIRRPVTKGLIALITALQKDSTGNKCIGIFATMWRHAKLVSAVECQPNHHQARLCQSILKKSCSEFQWISSVHCRCHGILCPPGNCVPPILLWFDPHNSYEFHREVWDLFNRDLMFSLMTVQKGASEEDLA